MQSSFKEHSQPFKSEVLRFDWFSLALYHHSYGFHITDTFITKRIILGRWFTCKLRVRDKRRHRKLSGRLKGLKKSNYAFENLIHTKRERMYRWVLWNKAESASKTWFPDSLKNPTNIEKLVQFVLFSHHFHINSCTSCALRFLLPATSIHDIRTSNIRTRSARRFQELQRRMVRW